MRMFIVCAFLTMFCATLFPAEPEPFSAKEGEAIKVYEVAKPLVIACVEAVPNDSFELSIEWVAEIAKTNEIALDAIKAALSKDPFISDYIVWELKRYAKKNLAIAEQTESEDKAKFITASENAHKQAKVLEFLIDTWAPHEKQLKEVK